MKSKSKYGNIWTIVDGIKFQSKKEAEYYKKLLILKKAGKIKGFERQFRYPISINGTRICSYIADFIVYFQDGHYEVIDVKGVKTPIFRIKEKLMKAINGIEIKIV